MRGGDFPSGPVVGFAGAAFGFAKAFPEVLISKGLVK
jgi:hypothetical protein